MAKMNTIPPMCDTHDSDVAQALCLNHRRLMCFSCALKEASSKECVVKEIRELDENHALMLRCLVLGQNSSKKELLICEHEKKTTELRRNLEQKVMETYDKLNNRLRQLKDDCLETLNKQSHTIIQSNKESKQRLLTLQKTKNEIIDKLSEESMDDITDIERQLSEMETDILKNIEDKMYTVEGKFKENIKLVEAIMQSGANLSTVALIEQDHYAVIKDNHYDKPDISQKPPVYLSSEEFLEVSGNNVHVSNDAKKENVDTQQENGAKLSINEQKGHKGFFSRLFSLEGDKTKSSGTDKNKMKEGEHKNEVKTLEAESYADSAFSEPKVAESKHLRLDPHIALPPL